MEEFEGKVALITGGARGQGRSHAVAFAERGADIVICDRCEDSKSVFYPLGTEEDMAETVRLVEATGRKCIAVKADTADRAAMDALVQRAESEFGRVDIAVANAGVSVAAPVQSMTSAIVRTSIVLPRPGTPSSSTWLLASSPVSVWRTRSRWPTMTRPTSRSIAPARSAKASGARRGIWSVVTGATMWPPDPAIDVGVDGLSSTGRAS